MGIADLLSSKNGKKLTGQNTLSTAYRFRIRLA
nr:MAG TPA_asm: hypothetical protein [Caudoviricetes sp.]